MFDQDSINDFINRFRNKNTRDGYEQAINRFVQYAKGKEINYKCFDDFTQVLLSSGQAPSSINRDLSALRSYLKYLNERRREIPSLPYSSIELIPNVLPPEREPLTKDEVDAMIKYAKNYRDKAIISLADDTGLRVTEVCSIQRDQIKITGTIGSRRGQFVLITKGNKRATKVIGERTIAFLDKYLARRKDSDPHLFVATKGNKRESLRMSRTSLNDVIKRAASRVGVTKRVTTHIMRHTFATNLLDMNTDIRVVQEMMGHSRVTTTQSYAHVRSERALDATERYIASR